MLEFDELGKAYGPVTALDGVSFTVGKGEVVGFVGANGAGKSTTMRIAMGVLAPDRGAVRWDGQGIDFTTRRAFGYMPEQRGLYPKMRIREQIAYLGELRGMDSAAAHRASGALLERLSVAAEPTAALQTLSLGNQQRVQLAAALVHDPKLLVLDEPFSGLDPIGVDTMAEVLAERASAGVAVLFSSHQLELVERLCDRIVIITAGRIVASGTLAELRASAGPRLLEVDIVGAAVGPQWLAGVPADIRASSPTPDGVAGSTRYVVALQHPEADQAVLAAAAAAGRVAKFGWQQPPLAELYREAVTAA